MQSILKTIGATPFPAHTGERVYMRAFTQRDGLPFDLERWQPTVDAMLRDVDAPGAIYLMVDQAFVRAGQSHRRPGVHIDGYWNPGVKAHGGHRGVSAHGGGGGHRGSWNGATYFDREAIILASDVAGCRAMVGEYAEAPGEGGDCVHIDTTPLQWIMMQPGIAYAGNVTFLHESLPVPVDCLRTVVRLNVPGWSPR